MGIEVTDVCMDKEADCVVVYSNNLSHESDPETFPHHNDHEGSYDHVVGDPELLSDEGSTEAKEYEVKECTTENSVEKLEPGRIDDTKGEQNIGSSKLEANLPEEKVGAVDRKSKDMNKSRPAMKHASKGSGNARTKHTIPQPFALATEKRASNGTRPAPTKTYAGAAGNRTYNANGGRVLTTKKINQVTLA